MPDTAPGRTTPPSTPASPASPPATRSRHAAAGRGEQLRAARRQLRRRRSWWLAGVGAAAAIATAWAVATYEPHKMFIDERVVEPLGAVRLTDADVTVPALGAVITVNTRPADRIAAGRQLAEAGGTPVVIASGTLTGDEHPTSGTAHLVVHPDGGVGVRLENLTTANGPDLHVALAPTSASNGDGGDGVFGELTRVADLKGNLGSHTYTVSPGTLDDAGLAEVGVVVIWSERFAVPFGHATLTWG